MLKEKSRKMSFNKSVGLEVYLKSKKRPFSKKGRESFH